MAGDHRRSDGAGPRTAGVPARDRCRRGRDGVAVRPGADGRVSWWEGASFRARLPSCERCGPLP